VEVLRGLAVIGDSRRSCTIRSSIIFVPHQLLLGFRGAVLEKTDMPTEFWWGDLKIETVLKTYKNML
jgi:hypothetical protein